MRYRSYAEAYRRSIEDPAGFWADEASRLAWSRPADQILDLSEGPHGRWFRGGTLNLCDNALDRHVRAGRGARPAIVWESPEVGVSQVWSYAETLERVERFAAVLEGLGVRRGDRVAIYLPMVPEAAVAMLACARLGAVHVVIFSGYAAPFVARRLGDSRPKVVVTASHAKRGGRLLPVKATVDEALAQLPPIDLKVVVLDRGLGDWTRVAGRDLDWGALEAEVRGEGPACVALDATDPAFVLYTAAGDGRTDGMVHDTGGYAVALAASMEHLFACGPDDVFWSTSDVGWVVGHSYIVYGPLLAGIPTVIYEGTIFNPHAGIWWELVQKHRVTAMYSAPTALRMLRGFDEDFIRRADLSSLHHFFVVGERLDAEAQRWGTEQLRVPVIDHYWQTESGWPMIGHSVGIEELTPRPGAAGLPCMGWRPRVVARAGQRVAPGTTGELVFASPLPPGSFTSVAGEAARFRSYYFGRFDGDYEAFDLAAEERDGYVTVFKRSDRVVNIAGHRLAIADVEAALATHEAVAEVRGTAVEDRIKTEGIRCQVVLRAGFQPDPKLAIKLNRQVREQVGAVAVPKEIQFVDSIPLEGAT